MGKKSSGDSMQAFRKAEKVKQLKKNKAQRKENREKQAVWRDTRDLEGDIAHLKSRNLDDEGKQRLATLESEFKYVNKLKEKYLAEHPEARDKVYHTRERPREQSTSRPDPTAHLYNSDGTLRDPKRSIYYDATYNPFGVPPPGMPYAERPPSEVESSDDDDDDDSDSDIVMPEGPRPDESDVDSDDSDDSDDIPLPAGPPPPRPAVHPPFRPPFRPPMRPMRPMRPPAAGWGHLMPGAQQPGAPPVRPPPIAVRPSSLPPRPSSLPAKPGTVPAVVSAPAARAPPGPAAATISADPQLRDFRKETTVFVPCAARKRAGPGGVTVNATPGAGVVDADGDEVRVRAAPRSRLMDKLGRVLGDEGKKDETEEEYERFLEGL
ncbi:hypothetical protein CspHIS471_0302210 [Cutaneotrichosporon sp. HIS471]|nr:hypothetical protein CspHIS471_0302210 [Cutaneotrichosporon sp. HIS471]